MKKAEGGTPAQEPLGVPPADRLTLSPGDASRTDGASRRRGAEGPPFLVPSTPAPSAVVCTHHRCHAEKGLGKVWRASGEQVVVCPLHALELLNSGGEWA